MPYHHRTTNNPRVRPRRVYAQVELDEQESAAPERAGHFAGFHAEDTPRTTTADVQRQRPARLYPSQKLTPRSVLRYRPIEDFIDQAEAIEMEDGMLYRQDQDQLYLHAGPPPGPQVPQRASRTMQAQRPHQAAAHKREMELTSSPPAPHPQHARRSWHWLLFVGLALLAMIVGYLGLGAFGTWWTTHQNDATYGRPRTFQADAVVGHGDSQAHPSHFIALNLKRHVIVIEIPGGDVSRSVIYSGPVLLGDGQDLTPVTLSFSDVNGDGRPDMELHILNQTIVFLNTGVKFVPPTSLASRGGSHPPIVGG